MTDRIDRHRREEAAKALVRDAIEALGPLDPALLPHRLKARLNAQALGEIDLDACIEAVLAETSAGRVRR